MIRTSTNRLLRVRPVSFILSSLLPDRPAHFPRFLSTRHHDPPSEVPTQSTAQPEVSHLKEELKPSQCVSSGELEQAESSRDARLLRPEAIVEGLQASANLYGDEDKEKEDREEDEEEDTEEDAPGKNSGALVELAETLSRFDPANLKPGELARVNREVTNIISGSGPCSEEDQAHFDLFSVRLLISGARAKKERLEAMDVDSPAWPEEQKKFSLHTGQLNHLLGRPFEDVDSEDPILDVTLGNTIALLKYRLKWQFNAPGVRSNSPR